MTLKIIYNRIYEKVTFFLKNKKLSLCETIFNIFCFISLIFGQKIIKKFTCKEDFSFIYILSYFTIFKLLFESYKFLKKNRIRTIWSMSLITIRSRKFHLSWEYRYFSEIWIAAWLLWYYYRYWGVQNRNL